LALYLDEKAEKPKEYSDKPNLEPFFYTSSEEFLGTTKQDPKFTEMTKLK